MLLAAAVWVSATNNLDKKTSEDANDDREHRTLGVKSSHTVLAKQGMIWPHNRSKRQKFETEVQIKARLLLAKKIKEEERLRKFNKAMQEFWELRDKERKNSTTTTASY